MVLTSSLTLIVYTFLNGDILILKAFDITHYIYL